jgi:hypothetical protein
MKRFVLFYLFFIQIAMASPAQIIIIRHAEKDLASGQLASPQGLERAAALAYYLTATPYLLNYGEIAAIFAARQVDQADRIIPRSIETVIPVSELLQLPVHSPFNGYQTQQMADFIMSSPQYDGLNILICWNHGSIISLLNAFGFTWPINTVRYPDCHFDYTFVLTFPQTSIYPLLYFQQLLFEDFPCCPGGCGTPPNCDAGICPNTSCDPSSSICPPYTPPPVCNPCKEP